MNTESVTSTGAQTAAPAFLKKHLYQKQFAFGFFREGYRRLACVCLCALVSDG